MKIKLTIEYDGENFHGWQTQKKLRTVQGELNFAILVYLRSLLKKKNISEDLLLKKHYIVSGSGRTDAGVSARAQVASFVWFEGLDFECDKFLKSINGITSSDLTIHRAEVVPDNFDARKSAISKEYSYRMSNQKFPPAIDRFRIYHILSPVDIKIMKDAALIFKGEHDFKYFRASDCSAKTTVRKIFHSELVEDENGYFKFIIKGNGFLKHMVRMIVGEIVNIGTGKSQLELLKSRLEGRNFNGIANKTAPAGPLTLEKVIYQDFVSYRY